MFCSTGAVCGLVSPNVCNVYTETFQDICNPEGWYWEHPKPFGHTLNDVYVISANDVWVVGSEQLTLHWDGTSWSGSFDGKKANLRGVWASSGSDGWAVGDQGSILRRQGTSWTAVPIGTSQDLRAVFGFGPTDVWVAGKGVAYHFNGTQWNATSLPGTATGLCGSSNDLWAVGKSSGFVSHWDGTKWT